MIVFRRKNFVEAAENQAQAPQDNQKLQIEQMKTERQMYINQRTRIKLAQEKDLAKQRAVQSAQRIEQKKQEQDDKNVRQLQKNLDTDNSPKNVSLYKTRSKGVEPVGMPKK